MDRVLAAAAVVFAGANFAAAPARADPYFAEEVAIGGLTLLKTDAISMDSEDLYISRDIVRVKYRFTNTTDSPIDALVAFPLPDVFPPRYTDEIGRAFWSDPSELKFKTSVDGQPLALQIVEQAFFKGKDVSARLSSLHMPLNPRADDLQAAIDALPEADRDRLAADELLRVMGHSHEHDFWESPWTVRTTVTSHQTFPPRKTITVAHEYVPRTGDLVGAAVLDPLFRKNHPANTELATMRRDYCIDDGWLHSLDEMLTNKKRDDGSGGTTLGYVLKTGANWKGPIGDFRLVVDKGKPDSLVSFCAEGVKQISPTQFEVRHTNFTPKEDLNILFFD